MTLSGLLERLACNGVRTLVGPAQREAIVDGIIYIVGLIVVVLAVLSFLGLR